MLRWILIATLVVGSTALADNVHRIQTTRKHGSRPNSLLTTLRQQALAFRKEGPSSVNETLIDHDFDGYYTGIIHVGTPPQQFSVDLDTGSPPLWIAGENCKYPHGDKCHAQVHRYSLKNSSSGQDLKEKFSIYYGSGFAKGEWISDVVGLTPEESPGTAKGFHFASTDKLGGFSGLDADGIFGLSFSDASSSKVENAYIEWLRDNNVFEKPIFTVWLDVNATGHPVGGEIIFGGLDPNHCGDKLVTVPAAITKPWWTFNVDEVLFDGQSISQNSTAITDTGTTLLYGPADVIDIMRKKYPIAGPNENPPAFNCDEHQDIELTFQIGGKPIKLTAKELIMQVQDKCIIPIAALEMGSFKWLLGDVFIKGFCQIHNYKEQTLTLAESKHPNLK